MRKQSTNKLQKLAQRLRAISVELDELIAESDTEFEHQFAAKSPVQRNHPHLSDRNMDEVVDELKQVGRDQTVVRLADWNQKEIAELYGYLGGASRDKKKPRDWLIERILWQLFDFQSGHEILRSEHSGE